MFQAEATIRKNVEALGWKLLDQIFYEINADFHEAKNGLSSQIIAKMSLEDVKGLFIKKLKPTLLEKVSTILRESIEVPNIVSRINHFSELIKTLAG